MEQFDGQYVVDILGDFQALPAEAKDLILQTLDFVHRFETHPGEEIFIEMPDVFAQNTDPQPVLGMIGRYIDELKTCLRQNAHAMHRDSLPFLY